MRSALRTSGQMNLKRDGFFSEKTAKERGTVDHVPRNVGLLCIHHGESPFEFHWCVALVPSFILFSPLRFFIPQVQSHLIPGLPFCIPIKIPSYLYAFWIPILAFESLLCGMALFRGFQAFRYRRSVFQAGRHLAQPVASKVQEQHQCIAVAGHRARADRSARR